ncbi:MAG: T9SS type A sorting domain-containing protein [Candidatus Cloacimonetes bacterium]|nr:T9SS type A sorting domain-containing protein [Candidatus Cloacimonadota bacterium]
MKKLTIVILISIICWVLLAERVEEYTATQIAEGLLGNMTNSVVTAQSVHPYRGQGSLSVDFYIINLSPGGFVLVAADDLSAPVLGYSTNGSFPVEDIPAHIDWYLGEYSRSMREIRSHPEWTVDPTWSKLLKKDFSDFVITRDIAPLCATTWDQGWPYNSQCPPAANGPGGHVWAGCVATAMAQVMKKWNYPITGNGSKSYYADGYGTQTANFGETTYNWSLMPNSVSQENNHVTTLLYHCGVAVEMMYGAEGSGAYSSDARHAMVNYFRYNSEAYYYRANDYSATTWASMLRNDLDLGRPIIYRGQGSGGHAFVLDGYQGTDYFHFNWGWSGAFNGYFYLNNLNPNQNSFTALQAAVLNLYPSQIIDNDLAAVSLTGDTDSIVGISTDYLISVSNMGQSSQDDYQVQLYRANDILVGSVSGTLIQPGQSLVFTIPWTPTTEGAEVLYGKVVLNGDQNPGNDTTELLEVSVDALGSLSGTVSVAGEPLAGASISMEGTNFRSVSTTDGTYSLPYIPSGLYVVSASKPGYYDDIHSVTIVGGENTTQDFTLADILLPPQYVQAHEVNLDAISINWSAPTAGFGGWLHYDDGFNHTCIGTNDVADFDVAIRFPASALAEYAGQSLHAVKAWSVQDGSFSIRVWTGGTAAAPDQLVRDQPFTPALDVYNTVMLANPVTITGTEELWFGYRCDVTSGYPAGCDEGPATDGLGNMMFFNGEWATLLQLAPSLNYNWNIQGYVGYDAPSSAPIITFNDASYFNTTDARISIGSLQESDNRKSDTASAIPPINSPSSRALIGYRVWRLVHGEENNEDTWVSLTPTPISTTEYLDITWNTVDYNSYRWAVKAIYSGGEASPAAFSNIITLIPFLTQDIALQSGRNLVSLNVSPDDPTIDALVGLLAPYLIQIKDSEAAYIPGNPFSSLTSFSDGRGYNVLMSSSATWSVEGRRIPPDTPISLDTGWNLAAYIPQTPMAATTALIGIFPYLLQVKGMEGIYEPGNPYNTLHTMSPGRAYWISMETPASFVYPVSTREMVPAQHIPILANHGSPMVKSDSQAILCELDESAQEGDILAAFVNGELRGLAPVIHHEGKLGTLLQVYSEIASEPIDFKLFKPDTREIVELTPGILSQPGTTLGSYAKRSFHQLKAQDTDAPMLATSLISSWPNPFQASTTIRVDIAKDHTSAKLEIFNLRGQKIRTLLSGPQASGSHHLTWDGKDKHGNAVVSGIYFCRLSADGKQHTMKLMLLK